MAPLRYAAKFDPFLSLDCARVDGAGVQFCHLATLSLPSLLPVLPSTNRQSDVSNYGEARGHNGASRTRAGGVASRVYIRAPYSSTTFVRFGAL